MDLHIIQDKYSNIATDKRGYPHNIFLMSPRKHVVGTQKRLGEELLIFTHNIYFRGEMWKISAFLGWKNALSVAM